MSSQAFETQSAELARRLLEVLGAAGSQTAAAGGPAAPTAWELRLKLKTPLAHVYMALGRLMAEGAVEVSPEDLGYRVCRSSRGLPAGRSAQGGSAGARSESPTRA